MVPGALSAQDAALISAPVPGTGAGLECLVMSVNCVTNMVVVGPPPSARP